MVMTRLQTQRLQNQSAKRLVAPFVLVALRPYPLKLTQTIQTSAFIAPPGQHVKFEDIILYSFSWGFFSTIGTCL